MSQRRAKRLRKLNRGRPERMNYMTVDNITSENAISVMADILRKHPGWACVSISKPVIPEELGVNLHLDENVQQPNLLRVTVHKTTPRLHNKMYESRQDKLITVITTYNTEFSGVIMDRSGNIVTGDPLTTEAVSLLEQVPTPTPMNMGIDWAVENDDCTVSSQPTTTDTSSE